MEISTNDLEWLDDRSSLLGTGAFASVYRGKLKLPEKEQLVALKVWKDQLNDSNASAFLAEAETLRYSLLSSLHLKMKSFHRYCIKKMPIFFRGNQCTVKFKRNTLR